MKDQRHDDRSNGRDSTRLEHVYMEQLGDIREAEAQAAAIFPDMGIVATDEEVASVFRAASAETEVQIVRLERLMEAAAAAGIAYDGRPSSALDGILSDVRAILGGNLDSVSSDLDATLLDSARRSLRYQIAGYESACATARRLGDFAALDVLLQSLDEELATDSTLSELVGRRSRLLRSI